MDTERDTHFQKFAQLLWNELDNMVSETCYERADQSNEFVQKAIQGIQKLIAQRAYDLVHHACIQISNDLIKHEIDIHHEALFEAVQDLIAWPEPSQ